MSAISNIDFWKLFGSSESSGPGSPNYNRPAAIDSRLSPTGTLGLSPAEKTAVMSQILSDPKLLWNPAQVILRQSAQRTGNTSALQDLWDTFDESAVSSTIRNQLFEPSELSALDIVKNKLPHNLNVDLQWDDTQKSPQSSKSTLQNLLDIADKVTNVLDDISTFGAGGVVPDRIARMDLDNMSDEEIREAFKELADQKQSQTAGVVSDLATMLALSILMAGASRVMGPSGRAAVSKALSKVAGSGRTTAGKVLSKIPGLRRLVGNKSTNVEMPAWATKNQVGQALAKSLQSAGVDPVLLPKNITQTEVNLLTKAVKKGMTIPQSVLDAMNNPGTRPKGWNTWLANSINNNRFRTPPKAIQEYMTKGTKLADQALEAATAPKPSRAWKILPWAIGAGGTAMTTAVVGPALRDEYDIYTKGETRQERLEKEAKEADRAAEKAIAKMRLELAREEREAVKANNAATIEAAKVAAKEAEQRQMQERMWALIDRQLALQLRDLETRHSQVSEYMQRYDQLMEQSAATRLALFQQLIGGNRSR